MRGFVLLFCSAFLSLASLLQAQTSSALINQALDKQTKLELNTTLPNAMNLIGQVTGVRLEADPAVWDLLPWGEQTPLVARIDNITLREALDAITRKLGLTYTLKDEAVELQPLPALRRLARRSTVQELQALDALASIRVNSAAFNGSVRNLIALIDQQLLEGKTVYAIENRAGSTTPNQMIELPRNATLLDALSAIDRETNATWYPWGKSIVLIGKEEQVRSQLAKTITARYSGVDISQVLLELSQRAGVPFTFEPGAIERIAPEHRTVKLTLDNAGIQQALESIAGFTGLGNVATEKGVYLWNQQSHPTPLNDPIMVIFPMDNGLQGVITASQLPPELRDSIRARTQKEIERIKAGNPGK